MKTHCHSSPIPPVQSSAQRYLRISLGFVLVAIICVFFADIEFRSGDPWLELYRIGHGLITPDFSATESLGQAIFNTVAFALVGVVLANLAGFVLALLFHWRPVRIVCALIRSIHELFWGLLFLQVFGLSTVTGILAISIPFAGIFAKVYAEILEESDRSAWALLPAKTNRVAGFFYARLPLAWSHLRSYSLYRFECAIRSSAVLGFIGLPTLGFHLESAFNQGLYSEASALLYLFFLIIASLRHWMKLRLLPVYLFAAFIWLPTASTPDLSTLVRFVTQDIIPSPLRAETAWNPDQLMALWHWFWHLLSTQGAEGAYNTLILTMITLVVSGVVSLLLFPLVSPLFLRKPARAGGHALLVVFRSIPELMLAYLFMLVTGPSMLPAIAALSLHNGAIIGHLLGGYSKALVLRPDHASGAALYLYEALPRIYRQFLAFLFYRWEVIMRETAILGILGIHTLGFYIDSAFEEFRFDRALLLILLTAALNMLVDSASRRLRHRLSLANLPDQANC